MVNERIRAAVVDSGFKKKFVAEAIGLSEPVFSAILAGKRTVSAEEFFEICKVLRKTPDELYNYESAERAV